MTSVFMLVRRLSIQGVVTGDLEIVYDNDIQFPQNRKKSVKISEF